MNVKNLYLLVVVEGEDRQGHAVVDIEDVSPAPEVGVDLAATNGIHLIDDKKIGIITGRYVEVDRPIEINAGNPKIRDNFCFLRLFICSASEQLAL